MTGKYATADSFHFAEIKDGTSNTLGYMEQKNLFMSASSVENDETHRVGRDSIAFVPEVEDEVLLGVWGDPHMDGSEMIWGG